jgi:hypothetical protein
MGFKGTKGESRIILNGDIIVNEQEVATVLYSDILDSDCNLANAELIKDAFNTVNKTGLTPSELLKQNKEMRVFINTLLDDIHNINPEQSLKRQNEYNKNFN